MTADSFAWQIHLFKASVLCHWDVFWWGAMSRSMHRLLQ